MSPLRMIRQVKVLLNMRREFIYEVEVPYYGPFAVVLPAEYAKFFAADYPHRELNGINRLLEILGFDEVRFVKGCTQPKLVPIGNKDDVPKNYPHSSRRNAERAVRLEASKEGEDAHRV